ncbi:hypothetical protein GCM10020255_084870 [Rhodococcus baikonurensis]
MLLDGHSLAFRAFYALPAENFKTHSGQATNAVYGFTSMLINLLRDEQPTHLAAAFDVSRQTFRADLFPEYKAQRAKAPDEFKGQIDITKDVLGALGIPVMAEEGFEADDVIATLTTQAEALGYRVLVVTGDRDSLQLVTDNVTVLYPKKGVSELTRFTPTAVEEKYSLSPSQYPDFAALRGDPSDNLPGIPGVGEKTATKWIREYGDLQGLVDNVDKVRGKVGTRYARTSRTSCSTVSSPRWFATFRCRTRPSSWCWLRGTARRFMRCSTISSSRFSAIGCSPPCRRPSPKQRKGSRSAATHSPRVRLPRGSTPTREPVSVTA